MNILQLTFPSAFCFNDKLFQISQLSLVFQFVSESPNRPTGKKSVVV